MRRYGLPVLSLLALLPALGLSAVAREQVPTQKFVPAPAKTSELTVRLERVGTMPTHRNPTAPVAAGSNLLLIDQAGFLYRWDGSRAHELLSPKRAPQGLDLIGPEQLLNVAANAAGSKVYVVFLSTKVPRGIPQQKSPRQGTDAWYVVYEFGYDGQAGLSAARPITALEVRTEGHTGGGFAWVDDDTLLLAVGDNGDSYEDGGTVAQDAKVHLSKILRIDVKTGTTTVAALGVRSCQRLAVYGRGDEARLDFVDAGGWVADEVNSIPMRELLGAAMPVNFGWGRAASDGRSREGTIFIDKVGDAVASIPADEMGFRAPVAEVGRERAAAIALAGPVSSPSFSKITALFGDLVSGEVFAVTAPLSNLRQEVSRVRLVDTGMAPVTIKELSGGERGDGRFFNFPDGAAGVLIERTGAFYTLSEVSPQ